MYLLPPLPTTCPPSIKKGESVFADGRKPPDTYYFLFILSLDGLPRVPLEIGLFVSVHNTNTMNAVGILLSEVPDNDTPLLH